MSSILTGLKVSSGAAGVFSNGSNHTLVSPSSSQYAIATIVVSSTSCQISIDGSNYFTGTGLPVNTPLTIYVGPGTTLSVNANSQTLYYNYVLFVNS